MTKRTSARKKAKSLAKHLRVENPDYHYLKNIFKYLREELEVEVPRNNYKLPYVPTDEQMKKIYNEIWNSRKSQDIMIIKTFLYTGLRVSEMVEVKLTNVDLDSCQIRINDGKGSQDRVVPFPKSFRELLAFHCETMKNKGSKYLFESNRRTKYTDRGVRKIFERYTKKAGLERNISPHKFRHYLFTWLKKRGVDDALIQPYSGHKSRKSLEIYSLLAIADAQKTYEEVISEFPI